MRLYLVRHAKSDWEDPALADRDRPLAARGRKAASTLAGHIERSGFSPALVLCSPARRTMDTLRLISGSFRDPVEILVEDELYGAPMGDLLRRLRRVPAPRPSVMLIGHNPGIEELARALVKTESAVDLAEGFPTAALAVVDFRGRSWGVRPAVGDLVSFVTPREL